MIFHFARMWFLMRTTSLPQLWFCPQNHKIWLKIIREAVRKIYERNIYETERNITDWEIKILKKWNEKKIERFENKEADFFILFCLFKFLLLIFMLILLECFVRFFNYKRFVLIFLGKVGWQPSPTILKWSETW